MSRRSDAVALDAKPGETVTIGSMKSNLRLLAIAFISICLPSSSTPLLAAEDGGSWVSLFNGKDLTGWTGVHDVTFEVKDGNLALVKGMGWLRTEKEFGDFILELEWRAHDKDYDSGIFIRCPLEGKPWPKDGWQVNLRYNAVGALVKGYKGIVPAETERQPVEQWVKTRLEVRGTKVTLTVNGEKAWEFDKLDRATGFIGIQAEDKAFDFRNIRLKELK
jgi:hypothetical protein